MQHVRASRAAVAVGNVLACSGLVGFIACSDTGVTEPVASAPAHAAAIPSPATVGFHPDIVAYSGDTLVQTFVYNPATGASVNFANRAQITVPAGAVCDPKSSGYGPSSWDKKCTPLTTPVSFTVRAWKSGGNAQAVVSPDVRFVPGKVAQLYMAAPSNDTTAKPVIQWCTSAMTGCVNEGTTDPALATQYAPAYSVAYRRIKHFSGYNIGWSRGASANANAGAQGSNGQ
ncbi:MAG TPA: hypothetical protein VGD56_13065 [Gemmatirosa sp.]